MNRCAWSLEIARERARVMEIDNQIFAAVEAARARQLAEARYSEQRRQALAAILYGVVIMVRVIAAAGGRTWILLALGDRQNRHNFLLITPHKAICHYWSLSR